MKAEIKTLRPAGYVEKKAHEGRRAPRNKFYNTAAWRKSSRAFLLSNPLCQCKKCTSSKYPLPSHHTDHIKPINPENAHDTCNGRFGEPLSEENFQALNRNCHARKSAKERHN